MLNLKPQVTIFRFRALTYYIAVNDRLNRPDSVTITKVVFGKTPTIAYILEKAYKTLSPYINSDYQTQYVSWYEPGILNGIKWPTKAKYDLTKTLSAYKDDPVYSTYILLHHERGLLPDHVITGYNFYMLIIGFRIMYTDPRVYDNLYKIKIPYKNLYKHADLAMKASVYWPTKVYSYITNHNRVLTNWINRDILNMIDWIKDPGYKRHLKQFICAVTWFDLCDAYIIFKKRSYVDKSMWPVQAFKYWYCAHMLERVYNKPDKDEYDKAYVADLQRYLYNVALNAKLEESIKGFNRWFRNYLPDEPMYAFDRKTLIPSKKTEPMTDLVKL